MRLHPCAIGLTLATIASPLSHALAQNTTPPMRVPPGATPVAPPSADPNAPVVISNTSTQRAGDPQDSELRRAAREGRSLSLNADFVRADGSLSPTVPDFHTVSRGDTLWDITGYYFQDPYRWPRVWALNPQITNPHWIFPGDLVRLREGTSRAVNLGNTVSTPIRSAPEPVEPQTIFLREEGWLDPKDQEDAGVIVGAPEDQMLLVEGDRAYVEFSKREPAEGEALTIYHQAQNATNSDRSAGHVVRVLGSAVVESFDRNRKLATVRITESIDAIERGERLAPIPRRIEVVPPRTNEVDLRAHIVAAVQPRALLGQNNIVFIDRGADDKVKPGNRLFVMRRGDGWRRTLSLGSPDTVAGSGLDRDGDGIVDRGPPAGREERNLPNEVLGEIRVVSVRAKSAACIVTTAILEIEVGDVVEMREGF